jgi:hypothetical protein
MLSTVQSLYVLKTLFALLWQENQLEFSTNQQLLRMLSCVGCKGAQCTPRK